MAEKEYIEREAIKSKKIYSEERHEYVVPVAEIDWMTSADVAPVKHGRWKVSWDRFDNYASGHDYEFSECECNILCSNCHFVTRIPWEKQQDKKSFIQIHQVAMLRNAKTNYCPKCGAKMDMDGGEQK